MDEKIIFLDIDGVLNSVEYIVAKKADVEPVRLHRVDSVRVGLLRWLVDMTGAKIVISSTWRKGRDVSWFKGFFEGKGWPNPPILGMTPTSMEGHRGREVSMWLEGRHSRILSYVALDDDSDFYDYQPLVLCSSVSGLTLKNVVDAADILGPRSTKKKKEINDLRRHVDFVPPTEDS